MNQHNHHDYYLTRAKASHDLAQRAVSPAIAAIHAELAARYEIMVAKLQETGGTHGSVQAA